MRQSSFEDRPVDPVYPHIAYVHGTWAAACALAALIERDGSGLGQICTVAGTHAALIAGTATFVIDPTDHGTAAPVGPGGANPCYSRYRCADGRWLFLGALTEKFQRRAFTALDLEDIPMAERLGGVLDRLAAPLHRDWAREKIAARFESRTRDHWLDILEAAGCPSGPLLERGAWLDHPQIRAIGMRTEAHDSTLGPIVMPGIPLKLGTEMGEVRWSGVQLPPLEEELFAKPGKSGSRGGRPSELRSSGEGPLAGIRVLNLGTILAGPLAGCLLSELGADVIKVEPLTGDAFRRRGFVYNRGMRSIAIDLRCARGMAAFLRLVACSDVIIDNFRPGVLERLGISFEQLRSVNRDLVSFSMSGFGDTGPLRDKAGFDPILQAMSGMMAAQGGDDEPVFITIAVNDIAGAVMGALGVCLGVLHRHHRGEGVAVRCSLAAMSTFMQSGELVDFQSRPPATRGGRDFAGPGPEDRYYRTSDGWIRVQADIGSLSRLLDGKFTPDAFTRHCLDRTTQQVLDELFHHGVAASAARRAVDLLSSPDLMEAQLFHEHRRADGQPYFTPGRCAVFSRTQQSGRLDAPGLGQHTREVLGEAGLSDRDVDDLVAEGAVIEGGPFSAEDLDLMTYR